MLATAALAQDSNGVVTGTVYDGSSGDIMRNVRIEIVGTDFSGSTDLDGGFQIQVPTGTYEIRATMDGYLPNQFAGLTISENDVSYVDIVLASEESVAIGTEITVTATTIEEATEEAMILERRSASTISDIISSQEISNNGDSDAASAVGRSVGVSVLDGKYVFVRGLGERFYYPDFGAEETDILGETASFGAFFEVPTVTDFEFLGTNGWMMNSVTPTATSSAPGVDEPGMYALVLELRDPATGVVLYTTRTQFAFVSQVTTLSGTISGDMTLSNDKAYLLSGAVFVANLATLTIERGTVIMGESATNGTLVVRQGGKIEANGTWGQPIIFTSDQEVGDRARADWGGLIINGFASINITGGTALGEGDTGTYGGTMDNDSSGTLRYVRVEYAGTEFSPDNELNGIAFQGVGSGTTVDYVQVHFNQDDGVESFGGTVDVKHLLLTNIRDDSIDWTERWRGRGQFLVVQQNGAEADQGIEADNNAENNNLLPRANPTLYNLTLTGDPDTDEGTESDHGILVREGTAGTFRNFIVTGFKERGIDIDGDPTTAQAQSGDLSFDNGIVYGNTPNFAEDVVSFVGTIEEIDPMLVAPFNLMAPDFRPQASSPALDASRVRTPPDDGFFDTSVSYLGGVDPLRDFTKGWTTSHLD